jgi:hypothetical protein
VILVLVQRDKIAEFTKHVVNVAKADSAKCSGMIIEKCADSAA